MNRLPIEIRARLFSGLCEGMSIRGAARNENIAFNTALKFSVDFGRFCEAYQAHVFQELSITKVECDEMISFIGTKGFRKKDGQPKGWGDVYLWTSIDPITRLMPAWHVGGRAASDAYMLAQKLRWAIKDQGEEQKLQICTDGNKTYSPAFQEIFGTGIHYLQFHKIMYEIGDCIPLHHRYSLPKMECAQRKVIIGTPDMSMSTNHVERSNLTVRSGPKRFVRMTNAFSKKLENYRLSAAMQFFYYNFVRVHGALKTTPAVAAGLAGHKWSAMESVGMMDRPILGVNAA